MKRIVFALLFCICICSCTTEYTKEEVLKTDDRMIYVYSAPTLSVVMDKETGVEYLLYHYGGQSGDVTPLFNADGTLKVNKYFKEEQK